MKLSRKVWSEKLLARGQTDKSSGMIENDKRMDLIKIIS